MLVVSLTNGETLPPATVAMDIHTYVPTCSNWMSSPRSAAFIKYLGRWGVKKWHNIILLMVQTCMQPRKFHVIFPIWTGAGLCFSISSITSEWCYPATQDASHHQHYYIFGREFPQKTVICHWYPGWGGRSISYPSCCFQSTLTIIGKTELTLHVFLYVYIKYYDYYIPWLTTYFFFSFF